MTATERLRALLDERGVEWGNIRNDGSESDYLTEWQFENNQGKAIAIEWAVGSGLSVEIHRNYLTPEQAIAATLGTGTCHNASKVMDEHGQARFACSECGAWIDSRMLWNPEYRNGESPWVKDCKLNFCPNCGRRIVDPTTNDVDGKVDA